MERCIQTQQVNGTNTASEWNKYHCIRVTCHISKQNTAENTTIYWVWRLDAPVVDTTAQPTIQRSGELVGVIRPQSKRVHLLWGVAWVGVSSLFMARNLYRYLVAQTVKKSTRARNVD